MYAFLSKNIFARCDGLCGNFFADMRGIERHSACMRECLLVPVSYKRFQRVSYFTLRWHIDSSRKHEFLLWRSRYYHWWGHSWIMQWNWSKYSCSLCKRRSNIDTKHWWHVLHGKSRYDFIHTITTSFYPNTLWKDSLDGTIQSPHVVATHFSEKIKLAWDSAYNYLKVDKNAIEMSDSDCIVRYSFVSIVCMQLSHNQCTICHRHFQHLFVEVRNFCIVHWYCFLLILQIPSFHSARPSNARNS